MCVDQALPAPEFAGPPRAFLVVEGYPRLLGQVFNGLSKGEVVDFLQESDRISALAASETVPQTKVGSDVEGGRFFVVEGAQALH